MPYHTLMTLLGFPYPLDLIFLDGQWYIMATLSTLVLVFLTIIIQIRSSPQPRWIVLPDLWSVYEFDQFGSDYAT